jgi:hypothetical protein
MAATLRRTRPWFFLTYDRLASFSNNPRQVAYRKTDFRQYEKTELTNCKRHINRKTKNTRGGRGVRGTGVKQGRRMSERHQGRENN